MYCALFRLIEAARTLTIEETERRVTTVSSITLWPSQSVLNDQYTCEALHPALQPNGSGTGNTNTAGKHMKITALVRVMGTYCGDVGLVVDMQNTMN